MLEHFLAAEVNGLSTKGLFDNLKIAQVEQGKYLLEHQGKYPVIFITLKDIKKLDFTSALEKIRFLMQELYTAHCELLESNKLVQNEKELFSKILNGKAEQSELENSLKWLSTYLYKHYNKKVYLLIDEHETPLQNA